MEFQNGEQGSASKFLAALNSLSARQVQLLDRLEHLRSQYLARFQSGLSALTLRSCRTASQRGPGVACRFTLEDMHGLDMLSTTASVRCDSRSAHLQEWRLESPESVSSIRFSASTGAVETAGNAWVVVSPDEPPEGMFTMELSRPSVIHQAVFDVILATPSAEIHVDFSLDGQTWSPASDVSRSGYRILVWFSSVLVRYLRLRILPQQPDSPGSFSYSFGLTDARVFSTRYRLKGAVVFRPRVWRPVTTRVRFQAPQREGVEYFLSLSPYLEDMPDGLDYIQLSRQHAGNYSFVVPGQILDLPQIQRYVNLPARVVQTGSLMRLEYFYNDQWQIQLPPRLLWNSLRILDENRRLVPVWPDCLPVVGTTEDGFAEVNKLLYWVGPASSQILQQSWTIQFSTAPEAVLAACMIQLSSRNPDRTPVAGEAWLEEIPEPASP